MYLLRRFAVSKSLAYSAGRDAVLHNDFDHPAPILLDELVTFGNLGFVTCIFDSKKNYFYFGTLKEFVFVYQQSAFFGASLNLNKI
jgi:hypothetical protein